jgi:putative peptide zinc metalloprotease protein
MSQFSHSSRVAVRPIALQHDGNSVTLGDLERQVFLTVPAEAMLILSALQDGRTVGEAAALYEREHGVTPDAEGFLDALSAEGLVSPWQDGAAPAAHAPHAEPRLGRISPALARRLVGMPTLVACALLVAAAIAIVWADPDVLPGIGVLVFRHDVALLGGAMFVITSLGIAVHELGHLLVARASGVPARLGFGHRLWVLVAETDMTGMWMAPKRRRYLAFLAGPISDATSAATLVGVLLAQHRGWIDLSPSMAQLAGAVFYSYLLRLLWQCFVFVRTDFYYVLATALDCKSLLADTEDLLRNRLAAVRRKPVVTIDQSAIPPREMRAVRAYAVVWLAGRALAVATLVFISVPLLAQYAVEILRGVEGHDTEYGTVDLVVIAVVGIAVQGAGLVLWIRSLYRGHIQRRTDALATQ